MQLSELLANVPHRLVNGDAEITGIAYDSRAEIAVGDLFCCIVGTALDGHMYAEDAYRRGAAALLVERELPIAIPQAIVGNARIAMATVAAGFYGNPSRELKTVGVTGTNGKTSVTYMVKAIAERAGKKVGVIGTIKNTIGDEVLFTSSRTTPESVPLQATLRKMADAAVDIVVMEVSSSALDQYRTYGVEFDVAAFTNLTQDHLDYHKTFEHYRDSKKRLFYQCRHAVMNVDDANAEYMMADIPCAVTTTAICNEAGIMASDIELNSSGVQFTMHTAAGDTAISIPIPGLFTVKNAVVAAGIALELGFTPGIVREALANVGSIEGRLEPLPTGGRGFNVYLDFAHTPDALQNVLTTVSQFAEGRVIALFGCGGDKDKAKRAMMGEIAGRFSDFVVLTSDNPRTENPRDIIAMVEEGVRRTAVPYVVIESRREAIRYALQHGRSGDCIILAGKGHEDYQEINGVKHHFDEKEVVAELLLEI
ncbi:MAG: UDP-N-acetylmuramoyl-L-alanyl-D-glutamate--2,6-diaminopimelate ligase [Clostridia bacterium]|nr:UDP-N-acetylmuramoyl-L-alanyl-D-glutamate--2,6-diaminopimelate ligase [Clostridia bacterium]